jgi:hypothetical protein
MKPFLTNSIAGFLGFTFWGAGMSKLYAGYQFIGWIGPRWLVERLAEYGLGLYAEFIALSQIVIGFMLLTTRFKLMGGIMLVPMLVNILMVTISQNWAGTPYVLGVLLLMNAALLWSYRDFAKPLFNEAFPTPFTRTKQIRTWTGHLVWMSGLVLNLVSIAVSKEQLYLAFALSAIGVALGVLSFRVDRYYLEKSLSTPPQP